MALRVRPRAPQDENAAHPLLAGSLCLPPSLPFAQHSFPLRVLVNVNGCSFLFQRSSRDTVLWVDGFSWVRATCKAHIRCLRDFYILCSRLWFNEFHEVVSVESLQESCKEIMEEGCRQQEKQGGLNCSSRISKAVIIQRGRLCPTSPTSSQTPKPQIPLSNHHQALRI